MANKYITVNAGIDMASCKDCNKNRIGTKIFEYFTPEPGKASAFIAYRDGMCYINEQIMMSLIRMANPHQKDRKIKVVSAEEFLEIRLRKKGE